MYVQFVVFIETNRGAENGKDVPNEISDWNQILNLIVEVLFVTSC